MQNDKCPTCGHEVVADAACPACVQANGNGTMTRREPTPPPEVANWVIEPTPPEVAEFFRRTFDEGEYWAEFHEAMRTGGADIDALLAEVERIVHGKE